VTLKPTRVMARTTKAYVGTSSATVQVGPAAGTVAGAAKASRRGVSGTTVASKLDRIVVAFATAKTTPSTDCG
jgi:hypothetical protein